MNITNPGYGALGSYSIVLGSLGTGVTFDFIQEVQVKTAGYEAQYGQATGGVVSVVTKTGTNQLRGTVFGYTQPAGVQGSFTPVSDDEREPGGSGQHHGDPDAATSASRAGGPVAPEPPVLLRRDRSAVEPDALPGAGRVPASRCAGR